MSETIRLLIALSIPLGLVACLSIGWLRSRKVYAVLSGGYLAAVGIYLSIHGITYVAVALFILLNAAVITAGILFRKSPMDKGAGPNRRTL